MGLPRPITDAEVIERGTGDLAVRLRLDDGTCHTFGGQDYYDPPKPFADAADVFFFLDLEHPGPGHGPRAHRRRPKLGGESPGISAGQ